MPGLLNWIRASRQRKRERWEANHGHLNEHERHAADASNRAGATRVPAYDPVQVVVEIA
jgi:hypothetical protein